MVDLGSAQLMLISSTGLTIFDLIIFLITVKECLHKFDLYENISVLIAWIEYGISTCFITPCLFYYSAKSTNEWGISIILSSHWITSVLINAPYYYFYVDDDIIMSLFFAVVFLGTSAMVSF